MIVEGGIRRRDNRIWYLLLGVFAATFLFTFLNKQFTDEPEAEAASLANFDPGYIISDWQMSNYTSMTEAEIQDFLWKKGKCYNTSFSAVGTRVDYFSDSTPPTTWHVKDGHTVCLAEEDMNGETAAHIIWQTAQDYKINPQVLIVLLQKETGLITDPIPNSWDYQRATGYGCPDTAACSSKYYGFKNQIRNAAALFRTVLDGGWTNYPLGENYVQYNPNAACGGSVVNIRSLATSALYRYTPYQPNAGALAAGYGTASCGAYGNRNFYLYFQDWFGGITYEAGFVALTTPRYFEIKKDIDRIDAYTGQALDSLPKGMIRKYNSKIRLSTGEWCLRTEFGTSANSSGCIKMSDLNEIVFEYEDIDEEKIIKSGAHKIQLRSGASAMDFSEYLIRKFVKKVTFLDVTYYVTEFDSSYNGSEYGIPEDDLLDSYSVFSTKELILKDNAARINPFTGEVNDNLEKGRIIKFAAEIKVEDKTYYQTEMNNANKINVAISKDNLLELSEYDYEAFIAPREMVLANDIDRINPFTGEVYDKLGRGRVIKFSSKIYINGIWYYRTEYNTINNTNAAIPAWAVREK